MSEIIVWEDKYSIGIDVIDKQHKQLVTYINAYYELLLSRQYTYKIDDIIKSTLNNLIEYSACHFIEEEKIMNSIQEVDFASHFKEHSDFCSKVSTLKTRVILGEDIVYELFDFMRDWLLNHILLSDQKIGKAYKVKKIYKILCC